MKLHFLDMVLCCLNLETKCFSPEASIFRHTRGVGHLCAKREQPLSCSLVYWIFNRQRGVDRLRLLPPPVCNIEHSLPFLVRGAEHGYLLVEPLACEEDEGG